MICIPLHYAPVQFFFLQIGKDEQVFIPLDQPFQKMGFYNRMIIPTANGLVNLSIPVKGGREVKSTMGDLLIDNTRNWQLQHWRTLTAAYRRSPWFEFYEPTLSSLYAIKFDRLADWNRVILSWILKSLQLNIQLLYLEESNKEINIDEKLAALRPANAREPQFVDRLPTYSQVFSDRIGFQQNVSVLDLLFNEGNQAARILLSK